MTDGDLAHPSCPLPARSPGVEEEVEVTEERRRLQASPGSGTTHQTPEKGQQSSVPGSWAAPRRPGAGLVSPEASSWAHRLPVPHGPRCVAVS